MIPVSIISAFAANPDFAIIKIPEPKGFLMTCFLEGDGYATSL